MSTSEVTLAEILKRRGYRTMCVGKWHLGHTGPYHPVARGFDSYFGIPYSNDMEPPMLMRDRDVIEKAASMDTLSRRYAEECVRFIEQSKGQPFFLYHPHTFPHIPLGASPRFRGTSPLGLYGDTMAEVDWGIGEILQTLRRLGLEEDTLVIAASDNGPWYQGHPGPFRLRKGSTYEGGVRVPSLARWPGKIPTGKVTNAVAATIDLAPTLIRICGAQPPALPLDGVDISPVLTGSRDAVERDVIVYFMDWNAQCARWRDWKLHLSRYNVVRYAVEPRPTPVNCLLRPPELYNLALDPGESYDVAPENPQVVQEITRRFERVLATMPEQVQKAFKDTQSAKCAHLPAGAPPRPEGIKY